MIEIAESRFPAALFLGVACSAMAPLAAVAARSEIVLHRFTGGLDGASPYSAVVIDQLGNIFGTTEEGGGACKRKQGCGTVFKLDPKGNETVVYAFRAAQDGENPSAVIPDEQGNLYGTTVSGGGNYCGCGTVFEVTQAGKHKLIYGFQGESDGGYPEYGVTSDDQ